MKIGILSMQEVKNYGSFLQAFSLKSNIESLGHICEFINIIPGKQLEKYRQRKFFKVKLLIKRLWGWDFIKRFRSIYKFQSRFSKEFLPYLGVKPGINTTYYDVIVIGSDEVFNCAQKTWFGFSPQLFGKNLNTGKIITYAASFGATTTEKLADIGIQNEVSKLLTKIENISVRDENSFKVIKELTGIISEKHVDPVLIFNYNKFVPKNVNRKNYMIVYTYPGRITDKKEINAIIEFAKSHSLKLISIGHYFTWCDEILVPSPFEVLAYFQNATYIVTDTFHGSIFSIKYNKQFCTIVRNMNNQKLNYLLKQFSLSNRILTAASQLKNILETPIEYTLVNEIIEKETQRSIQYLSKSI